MRSPRPGTAAADMSLWCDSAVGKRRLSGLPRRGPWGPCAKAVTLVPVSEAVSLVRPGVPAVVVFPQDAVAAEMLRTRASRFSVEVVVASLTALAWGSWALLPVSVTVADLTAVAVAVSSNLAHRGKPAAGEASRAPTPSWVETDVKAGLMGAVGAPASEQRSGSLGVV